VDAKVEATSGFEPLNKAFAELSLTTWVCRREAEGIKKQGEFNQFAGFRSWAVGTFFIYETSFSRHCLFLVEMASIGNFQMNACVCRAGTMRVGA
jgi:hypothetical protein